MRVGINDLKRGTRIIIDNDPHVVISVAHSHVGRGGAVVQSKVKNLRTGKALDRNFKSSDSFEKAELIKMGAQFVYEKRGVYWFHESGKPANRFSLGEKVLGETSAFLRPKMSVKALILSKDGEEEIINIELPVKAEYKVIDAPPATKGNTTQGGSKQVTIEGGARINVPLFIEAGDTIRVNTETGEYSERA